MADFKTHLSSGVLNGITFAGTGIALNHLTPLESGAVFIVGTLGALLPDLDSDTGKPLQLLFQLVSVMIPILAFPLAAPYAGPGIPFLLCYFTVCYLFINYGICSLIKKITKHRGILHSIPFSILCGELTFLLLYPSGLKLSVYGGLAVFSGCILHLFLDELNSMSVKFGFVVVLKSSSGSALKFFSPYLLSTILTYILVLACTTAILSLFIPMAWFSPAIS